MKKLNVGIVAHVDAGKTTLCESMLELVGSIKKAGRVDNGTATLDYNDLEKQRGITIYSKQISFDYNDLHITIVDTPGHVDFSSEMERTLKILDYAIIVINGTDGIQSHTKTVLELLNKNKIKYFIFFNKMDISYLDKFSLIKQVEDITNISCVNFSELNENEYEKIALSDDNIFNNFIINNTVDLNDIKYLINTNKIIPCYFGSALLNQGVDDLLCGLCSCYNKKIDYGYDDVKLIIYKISYDDKNQRLSHALVKQGILNVKDSIVNEKIDQIRFYQGNKYSLKQKAMAGDICVVTGLNYSYSGQVIGDGIDISYNLKSCMKYCVNILDNKHMYEVFESFKLLEQEDPMLILEYDNQLKQLFIHAMGEIHLEVLQYTMKTRFNSLIDFSKGEIIYLESIADEVIGYGHFEPLKHYAEVHIKLEPLDRNSGIIVENKIETNDCLIQYQKQIESYLQKNIIPGVLTKSKLSDIKFTILSAKSHQKHTSSQDFIEATKRAVRQALMCANNILLEPFIEFEIEINQDCISNIIFELEQRSCKYKFNEDVNNLTKITGSGPVGLMFDFERQFQILTQSNGKYFSSSSNYKICRNQDEIINNINYDPLSDESFPANSIFCKQGAGYSVPYQEVKSAMHLDTNYTKKEHNFKNDTDDLSLESIFEKTYGKVQIKQFNKVRKVVEESKTFEPVVQCYLIDGYNLMHELSKQNNVDIIDFQDSRNQLINIVADYQGYKNCLLIIVFDGHKVVGGIGSKSKINENVHIVYTKESQTADMYIESITGELASKYQVTVVTSDALQQLIVLGQGATRLSSREFFIEYDYLCKNKLKEYNDKQIKHFTHDIKNTK